MENLLFYLQRFFVLRDWNNKKNHKYLYRILFIFIFFPLSGCCKFVTKIPDPFPIQSDVILGRYAKDYILNHPSDYGSILDETTNQEIYTYIKDLTNTLLNSGLISYKDNFEWEVRIIKDDGVINAFACPGGYLFIYTGLLKFMGSEDEALGVLGHEIAHADKRHSTKMLIKQFGLAILAKIVRGEASPSEIEEVAKTLLILKFSRCDEKESDNYSVRYLCNSIYNAAGAASLFQKMLGRPSPPEFLISHPSFPQRIRDINKAKADLNCTGVETNQVRYQQKIELLN
jgi:beta-barrel assembly-enhancing protease